MDIIIMIFIGLVAGWLASMIMKGGGMGVLWDIIIGVIGALIGGYVFGLLGIAAENIIGRIIAATIGAVILLFIVSLLRKTTA